MYIRADQSGNIQLTSKVPNVNCVEYTGTIPTDFFATVGLGKYTFLNNTITAVAGWVQPPVKQLPTPQP